jgi:hypothetical protein
LFRKNRPPASRVKIRRIMPSRLDTRRFRLRFIVVWARDVAHSLIALKKKTLVTRAQFAHAIPKTMEKNSSMDWSYGVFPFLFLFFFFVHSGLP